MTSNHPPSKTDQTEEAKNPYTPPTLVEYGNIREITRAVGGVVGKNDGGSGKDKTG